MDHNKMCTLQRGPSIDASYQVSVHLAEGFQKRRFFKKSANQKQEFPVAAMFVNGQGRNEQSLQRTFHRCFLPSFSSFGLGVSEEKIKMRKVNGQTTDDGCQVMAKAKNYSLILLILVSIFIFSFYHTTATHFRLYYAMGLQSLLFSVLSTY